MSRSDDPSDAPAPSRPPRRSADDGSARANWTRGTDAIGAALTFAIAVGAFTFGGWWLDGKLGLSPLFLIVGAGLGLLGGFLYVVKTLAPEALPWTAPPEPRQPEPRPPGTKPPSAPRDDKTADDNAADDNAADDNADDAPR